MAKKWLHKLYLEKGTCQSKIHLLNGKLGLNWPFYGEWKCDGDGMLAPWEMDEILSKKCETSGKCCLHELLLRPVWKLTLTCLIKWTPPLQTLPLMIYLNLRVVSTFVAVQPQLRQLYTFHCDWVTKIKVSHIILVTYNNTVTKTKTFREHFQWAIIDSWWGDMTWKRQKHQWQCLHFSQLRTWINFNHIFPDKYWMTLYSIHNYCNVFFSYNVDDDMFEQVNCQLPSFANTFHTPLLCHVLQLNCTLVQTFDVWMIVVCIQKHF